MSKHFLPISACCVCALIMLLATPETAAQSLRVGDMIGKVVVTPEGELLGRVEDLALDSEGTQVKYVVVSVGSYLIENNLVAVAPEALGRSSEGEYLVVASDSLDQAQRFGEDNWPEEADVLAAPGTNSVPEDAQITAQLDQQAGGPGALATISDGERIATLEGESRQTVIAADPAAARSTRAQTPVQRKTYQSARSSELIAAGFTRLDVDGDGYLSRGEAATLTRGERNFESLDLDGNNGIDPFEYRAGTE